MHWYYSWYLFLVWCKKSHHNFFFSKTFLKNNRLNECCTFIWFPGNHMSDKESVEELPSHITKDLPHTMTQHKHLQLLLQQRYLNQATNSEPKAHRYTEPAANSNNLLQAGPDRMVSLFNVLGSLFLVTISYRYSLRFWRFYLLS